jgi:hypothetical protein
VIALAISLLVSIVALSALAVAVDAREQAADAQSQIDSGFAPNATVPAPPEPDEAVSAPGLSEPPTDHTASPEDTATPTDVLNPQAVYTPVYSGEVLNPQVTGDSQAYVDLDEPRVGADFNKADIRLDVSFRVDVPYFQVTSEADDHAAAEAGSPTLTPEDCADLIRTGPLPDDAQVPAQRGTVLCIATSPTSAAAQGINQRIAVLHVTALGDDGRVTIEVSAWEVPR